MAALFKLSNTISLAISEIEITAMRAQGPGGQHVNKSATAIHLRFDSQSSTSLSVKQKERVLNCKDYRVTAGGVIIIKAQRYRSQEKNRLDALERLRVLLTKALTVPKKRKATKLPQSAIEKRLSNKSRKSKLKQMRTKPALD